jgi:hypothetical protein
MMGTGRKAADITSYRSFPANIRQAPTLIYDALLLFVPESHDRIYAHRTPCRQIAGP